MAGKWREVTVEEIKSQAENALATGPFGSAIASRHFTDDGIPVIRGSNLSEDIGKRLNDEGLVFLSPKKAQEFRRSTVRKGDLIFTCWGTINQVGVIDQRARYSEYVISNKQMKLTPDPEKADGLFLYYLFSSPQLQNRIKSESIGSSVPGFNLGQLRAMQLRIPEPDEQRAIAHILGTLDDKIELNRRMSETLEAMAQALFKSWFVDFDPVRAKAKGLTREPIGRHVETSRGFSYDGASIAKGGVPFHNLNSIFEGGGYKYDGIKTLAGDFDDRCAVDPGDIIVANTEQGHDRLLLASAALIPERYGPRTPFSHHLYRVRVRPGSPLRPIYLLHLLNDPWMHDLVSRYGNGTTVNMLPPDALELPEIAMPPADLIARFEDTVLPLHRRAETAVVESESLAAMRDALLPRLVSGDLRVATSQLATGWAS